MRESVVAERLQSMFPELREQLLGGAVARTVEAELERVGAVRCFFLDASVGVVFGVDLADGTRVALGCTTASCAATARAVPGSRAMSGRAAYVPPLRFHDLRHTFASLLIAQGSNVVFVSRQLGHSSPNVTLGVYAHFFDRGEHGQRAKDAMRPLLETRWKPRAATHGKRAARSQR